jgi:hypothetical protein
MYMFTDLHETESLRNALLGSLLGAAAVFAVLAGLGWIVAGFFEG